MQTRTGNEAASAATPQRKLGATGHGSGLRRQQMRYAILFVAPALIVYLVFMVYPFLYTIYLSLTNWNGVDPDKDFVGLANYARMFGDGAALQSFFNNVIWVIIGTIAPVVIGLLEALIVWSVTRGSVIWR